MVTKNAGSERKRFNEALKSARLGIAESQYEVGLMYANGLGTAQNLEQAVHWIRQAAQKGLPAAQYLLGSRYALGIVVQKDVTVALSWYLKAASQGYAKAHLALGKLMLESFPVEGVRSITLAAEGGLVEAQWELGKCYEQGKGVPVNRAEVLRWYQAAADAGHAGAQCAMGRLIEHGADQFEEAVHWYRKAARQGVPQAQWALALLDGVRGVSGRHREGRAPVSAERRKAASRWESMESIPGDAESLFYLGLMHQHGVSVKADQVRAEELFLEAALAGYSEAYWPLAVCMQSRGATEYAFWEEKAAQCGHVEAMSALAKRFAADFLKMDSPLAALSWYGKAMEAGCVDAGLELTDYLERCVQNLAASALRYPAEAGRTSAQFALGNRYAVGRGVQKDNRLATYWWEKSASQGHTDSKVAWATAMLQTTKDPLENGRALKYLEEAADSGHAKAQWMLGAIFAAGQAGVSIDLKVAFALYQRSAQAGFSPAQAALGTLHASIGKWEEARRWWRKAAIQNDAEAQFNLGVSLLAPNDALPPWPEEGFDWLLKAARQGLPPAQSRVGLCYVRGEGVVMDPVEAHKWFAIAANSGDKIAQENLSKSSQLLSALQLREVDRRIDEYQISHQKTLVNVMDFTDLTDSNVKAL